MTTYELRPIHDSRKSFYGKAQVEEDGDGYHLHSYETLVCSVWFDGEHDRDGVTLYTAWDYSPTTLRHVKEFLQQKHKFVGSKKEMEEHYKEVE